MLLSSLKGEDRKNFQKDQKSLIKESKSKITADFSAQGLPMNVANYFSMRRLERLKRKVRLISLFTAFVFGVFAFFNVMTIQHENKLVDPDNDECNESHKYDFMYILKIISA